MNQDSDQALRSRIAGGDPAACGQLYDRHARAVEAFCLRRTADPALAEDVTSMVFLEIWRARTEVTLTTSSAKPYLLGVAVNIMGAQWRSRRRHVAALERVRAATQQEASHEDAAAARVDAVAETTADGFSVGVFGYRPGEEGFPEARE